MRCLGMRAGDPNGPPRRARVPGVKPEPAKEEAKMRQRRYPVIVDTPQGRVPAGFSAPANEEPVGVSLRLRDRGWSVYKVRFDADAGLWIAAVINSKRAA